MDFQNYPCLRCSIDPCLLCNITKPCFKLLCGLLTCHASALNSTQPYFVVMPNLLFSFLIALFFAPNFPSDKYVLHLFFFSQVDSILFHPNLSQILSSQCCIPWPLRPMCSYFPLCCHVVRYISLLSYTRACFAQYIMSS